MTLGISHWQIVVGLGLGGVVAAPIGGWLVKRLHARWLLVVVGLLVVGLSTRTLVQHFSA
jgi:uncharacterized membrane protein YfcA